MIAVFGSTGTIGRHVASGLSEAGEPCIAMVRDPASYDGPIKPIRADLTDGGSLVRALDCVDDVFLLTPHGREQGAMEANVLEAARAAGVSRIVKLSGGAPSLGPEGASPSSIAHWRSEQNIAASGLAYQFLRPSFFMQNLLRMELEHGMLFAPMARAKIAMIDARDVAACAVALLTDRDRPSDAWHLTGPEGMTFSDVARLRGTRYMPIPPRLAAFGLRRRGASPYEVDHAISMAKYFAADSDSVPTTTVVALTGRTPRDLAAFAQEHWAEHASEPPSASRRTHASGVA